MFSSLWIVLFIFEFILVLTFQASTMSAKMLSNSNIYSRLRHDQNAHKLTLLLHRCAPVKSICSTITPMLTLLQLFAEFTTCNDTVHIL